MINRLAICVLALFVSACSQQRYEPEPVVDTRQEQFLSLVSFVQSTPTNVKPSKETRDNARNMAFSLGLHPICINKGDCFLVHGSKKVRIEPDHVVIEFPQEQRILKVYDAQEAFRIIFYQ